MRLAGEDGREVVGETVGEMVGDGASRATVLVWLGLEIFMVTAWA